VVKKDILLYIVYMELVYPHARYGYWLVERNLHVPAHGVSDMSRDVASRSQVRWEHDME
jgi:hypothetical protein